MGTTLTGTTPQDTYDSLIKVTDNGPLSGSLKTLTDGLGNDSALALSTGAASITGTLAVSSNGLFGGSTNAGNAGTNTISVGVAGTSTGGLQLWAGSAQTHYVQFGDGTTGAQPYAGYVGYNHTADSLIFGSASADRLTITSAGNVGIGTSNPQQKLHVAGVANDSYGLLTTATNWALNLFTGIKIGSTGDTYSAGVDLRSYSHYSTSAKTALALWVNNTANTMVEVVRATENGLTFNGDTAAANALDDYEEGTWTPAVAFGGASVGVTYALQQGSYTKIGRQVTVTGYLALSSKGSSSGAATITGLPFTIPNSNANYSSAAVRMREITFGGQFQWIGNIGTTTVGLRQTTEGGTEAVIGDSNFANDSEAIFTFTYFV